MSQIAIPAAFVRGGTSKAVVLKRSDLPVDEAEWPAIFLAMLGSPDPHKRQLNGMGGGISSLSKICVIGPTTRPDADIDYTFAQIGVVDDSVDFSGNCGNMSSAMGPFAYDEGLIEGPISGDAVVRIHNTNSGKVIVSKFAVSAGKAVVTGGSEIPGVYGTGAPVELEFLDPTDTFGRGTLPHEGEAISDMTLSDGRIVSVTMIDAAVPVVFVDASSLGCDTSIHPEKIDADVELMARFEEVRREASVCMGLTSDLGAAAKRVATPKVAAIGVSGNYKDLSGSVVAAETHDLQIRMISAGQAHRAVPITGALALACASICEGSIVQTRLSFSADHSRIRIGTPSGVVTVGAEIGADGRIERARILRTQRRLMDGHIYVTA